MKLKLYNLYLYRNQYKYCRQIHYCVPGLLYEALFLFLEYIFFFLSLDCFYIGVFEDATNIQMV